MKNIVLSLTCLFWLQLANGQNNEEALIKAVVNSAYVEGIQNSGNVADIRKGFHPSFTMLRVIENDVKPYSIEEWIAAIEKRKAEAKPDAKVIRTEANFLSVDVTGTAATVKLELYRDGKKTFTDYIVLYKFTEGWRIVSKTFYRHP
ncbi:MAG: nuclear transport factor 2 family protein [Cyclobacteriaceae bacterium]|nr:nuclear transport factor 2 family protein [Cyclobacteriaceae bacterium]